MPSGKKRSNDQTHGRPRAHGSTARAIAQGVVFAALALVLVFIVYKNATYDGAAAPVDTGGGLVGPTSDVSPQVTDTLPTATPEPTPTPTPEPFEPHAVDSTEPSNYIVGTAIEVDGVRLADGETYEDDTGIYMDYPENYSSLNGVITFRGDNLRSGSACGTANITNRAFGSTWTHTTGTLIDPNDGAVWSGNGWTGQPLIAEWPYETRQIMTNMHDWARDQETLVEVIYPSMDGYVYFLELQTGKETRDPLNMGLTYKGTGTLDPRGYPLLYIGSGYNTSRSKVSVISLIDGSVLYEFGNSDGFALRAWPMFDSAPLIDADTDKLIWAGENGILYIITLGTEYDEEAGTVSVSPTRTVKWRYQSVDNRDRGWYLGFEASPIVWQGYIFLADNSGNLMCLDLDTLELVWVQDILDDSNCTPVLDFEDGHPYLYISTSYHLGWRSWTTATVPIWKIDAETGEIVWQNDSYTCYSVDSLSGGAQSSMALGKGSLDGLVFLSMARYPTGEGGRLLAIDKATGEEVWSLDTQLYSWSTPTVFYDQDGTGYVVYVTLGGYIYLIDGLTGERLDTMNGGGHFEATPAVYDNWMVVGHRNGTIWGIELT